MDQEAPELTKFQMMGSSETVDQRTFPEIKKANKIIKDFYGINLEFYYNTLRTISRPRDQQKPQEKEKKPSPGGRNVSQNWYIKENQ
jgi:hypothetical protein